MLIQHLQLLKLMERLTDGVETVGQCLILMEIVFGHIQEYLLQVIH